MSSLRTQMYLAVLSGLTILFALIMPKVILGPFSATLGLHTPLFLSFIFGPFGGFLVGIISAFGFILTGLPLVIAARAAMHGFVGLFGGWLFASGKLSFFKILLVTAPLHALLESFIVLPFGFTLYEGLVLVGAGTLLHHGLDGIISLVIYRKLKNSDIL